VNDNLKTDRTVAMPEPPTWMLYGAYGRTGRVILEEAVRRGHRPVLAGRDGDELSALGRATGLTIERLPLEDGRALRAAVSRVRCVLLAAGPYHLTGTAMRAACLDAGCSYLDLNGEIEDFGAALACDERARAAGVAIIPGVGYGVVFAECVAMHVAHRLPAASWLRLSLDTRIAGRSRGATLSAADAMIGGGREIHQDALRKRAIAFSTWRAPRGAAHGLRFAAAPRAELSAVHRSTRIPNIVAGIPLSRVAAAAMRIGGPWIGRLLLRQAARLSTRAEHPPSGAAIAAMRSRVWAEAGDANGTYVGAMLETGEGYRAAAAAAVAGVELQLRAHRAGAFTPAQAFGPGFALRVPGTRIEEL
jgi:short subunit dehydrogenase-like uncharacterized protein